MTPAQRYKNPLVYMGGCIEMSYTWLVVRQARFDSHPLSEFD
jgi:hypothetical protein